MELQQIKEDWNKRYCYVLCMLHKAIADEPTDDVNLLELAPFKILMCMWSLTHQNWIENELWHIRSQIALSAGCSEGVHILSDAESKQTRAMLLKRIFYQVSELPAIDALDTEDACWDDKDTQNILVWLMADKKRRFILNYIFSSHVDFLIQNGFLEKQAMGETLLSLPKLLILEMKRQMQN